MSDSASSDNEALPKVDSLKKVVADCRAEDMDIRLDALRELRDIMDDADQERDDDPEEENPPESWAIKAVVDSGIVPHLVKMLQHDKQEGQEVASAELQVEVAGVLGNVAAGDLHHAQTLIAEEAIPALAALLKSPSHDVAERAACALGNLAGASVGCRDTVLAAGVLDSLLPRVMEDDVPASEVAWVAWTLRQLCRGETRPAFDVGIKMMETLSHLLHRFSAQKEREEKEEEKEELLIEEDEEEEDEYEAEEVLIETAKGLSCLADTDEQQYVDAVFALDVVQRALPLLAHPRTAIRKACLRVVGNVVAGNLTPEHKAILLGLDLFACLRKVLELSHGKTSTIREICWAFGNLLAQDSTLAYALMDANVLPELLRVLHEGESGVQREAAAVLGDVLQGCTDDHVLKMIEQGCLKPLVALLDLGAHPRWASKVSLRALHDVLHVADKHHLHGHMAIVARRFSEDVQLDHRTPPELVRMMADFTWRPTRVAWEVEKCDGLRLLNRIQRRRELSPEMRTEADAIVAKFFDGVESQTQAPRVRGTRSPGPVTLL